jgi:hypothetical protein
MSSHEELAEERRRFHDRKLLRFSGIWNDCSELRQTIDRVCNCVVFPHHIRNWWGDGASSRSGSAFRSDSAEVCDCLGPDHQCCTLDHWKVDALPGISVSYLHHLYPLACLHYFDKLDLTMNE